MKAEEETIEVSTVIAAPGFLKSLMPANVESMVMAFIKMW